MKSNRVPFINEDLFQPQQIYNYPHCGTQKTKVVDFQHPNDVSNSILYLGEGESGVVRQFWTVFPVGYTWTSMVLLRPEIRIYVGAGDITDFAAPPAENLVCTLKLFDFLGATYDGDRVGVQMRSNSIYDLFYDGTNVTFKFKRPMPFENGILIQFVDTDSGLVLDTGISWATYETGDMPHWRYRNWRLRSHYATKTLEHRAEAPFDSIKWLDVASGEGMVDSLFFNIADVNASAMPICLENNFEAKVDGSETINWQTSGFEDLFHAEPYYFLAGEKIYPDWGVTFIEGTNQLPISGYNVFGIYESFIFKNGCIGTVTLSQDDGTDVDMNFTTLYYAP
jgi:hypothetical protein